MQKKLLVSALSMICAFGMTTGCSTPPKNMTSINQSADANTEVANTRVDLENLRRDLGEHLSPTKFQNAEKALLAAEASLQAKKPNEKTFQDLAESRAWIEQSRIIVGRSKSILAKPLEARAAALSVSGRSDNELVNADSQLASLAKKIETGDPIAESKISEATQSYITLERSRITQTQINPIDIRIEQARNMSAKKLAPKSFARAESDLKAAQMTLKIDPFDRDQVKERIQTSFRSSNELLEVARETAKTPGASTEELVLAARVRDQANKQQMNSANVRTQSALEKNSQANRENQNLRAQVNELKGVAQPQEVLQKLRAELPEQIADIMMTPSGKIMIRLKQLQFKTNSADLSSDGAGVLADVRTALSEIAPGQLTIEGHTDSTGSAARNKSLSQSRAETVASVLKTDEKLNQASIETKGMGADQPLKNNQTKLGRAENRRVEITIEKF